MDFLPLARRQLIDFLWKRFKGQLDIASALEEDLNDQALGITLDHLTIIDLPSQGSGLAPLEKLFSMLGFIKAGEGFISSQSCQFIWMEEEGARESAANEPLPQIVVADFRKADLSPKVRAIIERLTLTVPPPPFQKIESAVARAQSGDFTAVAEIVKLTSEYLTKREHLLPTQSEFETVNRENDLLAWVMIFGREVNHFGIAVQHLHPFSDLENFTDYLESDLGFEFQDQSPQKLFGEKSLGVSKKTTQSTPLTVELEGGKVTLPDRTLKLVWRYPTQGNSEALWASYYRGFISEKDPKLAIAI